MTNKIALIFPGQGAQAVGMGKELAAAFPVADALFRQADEILGWPLSKICWEGPEEELTKTSVCQPALYVHGLAALAVVQEKFGDFPVAGTAGLSSASSPPAAAGTSISPPDSSSSPGADNSCRKPVRPPTAAWLP